MIEAEKIADTPVNTYAEECVSRGNAPVKSEYILIRKIPAPETQTVPEVPVCGVKRPLEPSSDENVPEITSAVPVPAPQNERKGGQNKTHERKANLNNQKKDSLCFKHASSNSCSYGETCTFSHDIISFLASKQPLTDPEGLAISGSCLFLEKYGLCPYGAICQYSESHTRQEDGRNITSEGEEVTPELLEARKTSAESNDVPNEARTTLRKKKYDFQRTTAFLNCWEKDTRIYERQRKITQLLNVNEATHATTTASTYIDISPDLKGEIEAAVGPLCTPGWKEEKEERRRRLDLSGKVMLAPLTTVGNLPFRRICVDFGVDITVSEMVLGTALLEGKPSEMAMLRRHPSEKIFGIQVAGGFPDSMTRVAQFLDENVECDFVDLNMGCPIESLHNKSTGCSLMTRPMQVEGIVRGMSSVMKHPLTVKMRKNFMEADDTAHLYAQRLYSWGASAMTLHGRTAKQRYTKPADWDYIKFCNNRIDRAIPFIGNGDVMNYMDFEEHIAKEACDSVMVGRGALIKPWVFKEIKEKKIFDISASERFDLYKRFVNYGLEHWGSDRRGIETTRRFLLEWLSFSHRYIPVGLLETNYHQKINWRPPTYRGRDDLETRLSSASVCDWVWISERLLGKVASDFTFVPKHKSNSYAPSIVEML